MSMWLCWGTEKTRPFMLGQGGTGESKAWLSSRDIAWGGWRSFRMPSDQFFPEWGGVGGESRIGTEKHQGSVIGIFGAGNWNAQNLLLP